MLIGLIIVGVTASFVFINRNYKKELFNSIETKGNELVKIYPAALFLLINLKKRGLEFSNISRKKKLDSLNVVQDIAEGELLYNVRRISYVLAILLCGGIMSVFYFFARDDGGLSKYTIERPGYGQIEKNISVTANGNQLDLKIGAVEFTLEETMLNFEKSYEYLLDSMLGKNDSLDAVSENLNLINYIDDYAINVSWLSSDPSIVDMYGEVKNLDFDQGDKKDVVLTAVLKYLDYSSEYEINITVVERKYNELERFIRNIDKKIREKELSERADKNFILPDSIDGKMISYKSTEMDYSYVLIILSIATAIAVFWGMDKDLDKKIQDRNKEMLLDYSEIVSKLNILTGAGMSTFKAWEKIVQDYEKKQQENGMKRFAYEEMKIAYNKVLSGVSEGNAYSEFGKRCNIHEYLKLGALLEQNVKKGAKGLSKMLEEEAIYAFEQRKNIARKYGEEAGTKMLIPMMLMLAIVMVIVMIPAFTSFGV